MGSQVRWVRREQAGPQQGHGWRYGHPIPRTSNGTKGEKPQPAAPLLCTDWVGRACLGRPACFEVETGPVGSSRPEEADKGHLGLQHLCVALRAQTAWWSAWLYSLDFWISGSVSYFLCLSLSLAMCLLNHVSACATLQVIHPP